MKVFFFETWLKKHVKVEVSKELMDKHKLTDGQSVSKEFAVEMLGYPKDGIVAKKDK